MGTAAGAGPSHPHTPSPNHHPSGGGVPPAQQHSSTSSVSPKAFHFEGLLTGKIANDFVTLIDFISINEINKTFRLVTSRAANTMLANNNGPNVGAGSVSGAKVPPLIREFVQSLDDKEWQSALFGLLQSQVS